VGARVTATLALLGALGLAACGGGKHESQAIKDAKRAIEQSFHGTGTCSDAGKGPVKCRVITLHQDPAVMNCSFPRGRSGGWQCSGTDTITRQERATLEKHAPRAKFVIHVSSVSRMTVPRSVVASGEGYSQPPFRLPLAYSARSRLHGKGPSLYLTINRDQYEDDLVTDTGNEARIRIYRRSGRLLSDWTFDSSGGASWDATTHVLELERYKVPSFFDGPRDPLSAFERLRRDGRLKRSGPRRFVDRHDVWTVNDRGVPVSFHSSSQHHRIDVRFLTLERLPITPELRRALRIGKHPTSRVIHTAI
jgi:hypothetical protein